MQSMDGSSPLFAAAYGGHAAVLQLLLAHGADVDKASGAVAVRNPVIAGKCDGWKVCFSGV